MWTLFVVCDRQAVRFGSDIETVQGAGNRNSASVWRWLITLKTPETPRAWMLAMFLSPSFATTP